MIENLVERLERYRKTNGGHALVHFAGVDPSALVDLIRLRFEGSDVHASVDGAVFHPGNRGRRQAEQDFDRRID